MRSNENHSSRSALTYSLDFFVRLTRLTNTLSFSSLFCVAYAKFAAQISGSLQIVLEPFADVQFLERSVLPYLDVAQISSVTVYGEDCNKIDGLLNSMENKGLGNIICNSHVEDFYVDNLAKALSDSDERIKGDDLNGENGWNVTSLLLVIVVFSVASCWILPSTKTLKDLRTRVSSSALSFLLNPGELLRKFIKSHEKRQNTEVDGEVKTEDSALLTEILYGDNIGAA